jgi:hypothetical protein
MLTKLSSKASGNKTELKTSAPMQIITRNNGCEALTIFVFLCQIVQIEKAMQKKMIRAAKV